MSQSAALMIPADAAVAASVHTDAVVAIFITAVCWVSCFLVAMVAKSNLSISSLLV